MAFTEPYLKKFMVTELYRAKEFCI